MSTAVTESGALGTAAAMTGLVGEDPTDVPTALDAVAMNA